MEIIKYLPKYQKPKRKYESARPLCKADGCKRRPYGGGFCNEHIACVDCGVPHNSHAIRCRSCAEKLLRKTNRRTRDRAGHSKIEELKSLITAREKLRDTEGVGRLREELRIALLDELKKLDSTP